LLLVALVLVEVTAVVVVLVAYCQALA